MTSTEIIATIKRSQLPTLCVEGVQDKACLRMLERNVGINGLILDCGGRDNLLDVWTRRAEIAGRKVIFLADKDLYVFKRIPQQYSGVIFTHGYSLENDILESNRWRSLFDVHDAVEFELALDLTARYYWNECNKYFTQGLQPTWLSSFRLVEDHKNGVFPNIVGYDNCALYKKIKKNPVRYLRGKNLLDCVHYGLSHKNRMTRYSPQHIFELSCKPKIIGNYRRLLVEIKAQAK